MKIKDTKLKYNFSQKISLIRNIKDYNNIGKIKRK